MNSARSHWFGLCLIVALAGCGRERESAAATSSSSTSPVAQSCPLGVEDAKIESATTAGGIDVTITAPPAYLEELRRRIRDAAALYGPGAHKGLGHHGMHLGAQRHGLRLTELPPLYASVDDVDGGARLHLVAKLSMQSDELRAKLRDRIDLVRAGPCD